MCRNISIILSESNKTKPLSPGSGGVDAAVSGPEGVPLVNYFLPRGGKVPEPVELTGVDCVRKAASPCPSSWNIEESLLLLTRAGWLTWLGALPKVPSV